MNLIHFGLLTLGILVALLGYVSILCIAEGAFGGVGVIGVLMVPVAGIFARGVLWEIELNREYPDE